MNPDENHLKFNYQKLLHSIHKACISYNRDPNSIHLVVVSKGQNITTLVSLYQLGVRDFAENYVQELNIKKKALHKICPDIRWHFIGKIQSNKIKLLTDCFCLHTVSSLKHAKLLNNLKNLQAMRVFFQLNLNDDSKRNGFSIPALESDMDELLKLRNIDIQGLMCIAPQEKTPDHWFALMQTYQHKWQNEFHLSLPCLSMGMSQDFLVALRHGATHLRIGSLLF